MDKVLEHLEPFELVKLLKKCRQLERLLPKDTYNHRRVVMTIKTIKHKLVEYNRHV